MHVMRVKKSRRASRGLARAAIAGAAVLLAASQAPPAAADESSTGPAEDALFGEGDPTYDGVWRQSLALLAQDAAGYTPSEQAVGWLLDQQCPDGSFRSYRAEPDRPCGDVTGADTNATALAAQALAAIGGRAAAVDSALTWLGGVQNEDGGWSFNPGGASDANSTAVVVGAFAAAGEDPSEVTRQGASPYDALAGLQLGCDAAAEERGAFALSADEGSGELAPNVLATVDAVLASYGSGMLVDAERAAANAAVEPPDCGEPDGGEATGPEESGEPTGEETGEPTGEETGEPTGEESGEESGQAAEVPGAESGAAGAAYLRGVLEDGDQHLMAAPVDGSEEQPDYGTTARAVLALAASGDAEAAGAPLEWLMDNHASWPGYQESPAALGALVLAAHAGGAAPEDFGGTDLIAALNALGPAPDDAPGEGEDGGAAEAADEDGGAGVLLWVLGAGLVVVVAAAVAVRLLRARGSD